MFISTHLLFITIIYPYHSIRAPFGPFAGVRLLLRLSIRISRISFPPTTLCPLLTPLMRSKQVALPSANFSRTRRSRAHERPPGVNTYLSAHGLRVYILTLMDRGLYLVLQARPGFVRLTRFLFVTPCICATPPQRSNCLPKHRHRIPRCLALYPSPPSGWV